MGVFKECDVFRSVGNNLCDLIDRIISIESLEAKCKNCIKIVSKLMRSLDPVFFGSLPVLHNERR